MVEEEKMESKKLKEKSFGVDLAFHTFCDPSMLSVFQEFGYTIV